jgi:hypothetical protein
MGAQAMTRFSAGRSLLILIAFSAGIFAHLLYLRWNPALTEKTESIGAPQPGAESPTYYRVNFIPLSAEPTGDEEKAKQLEKIVARDVEKIRSFTGQQARVHGRVFRVGHAAKSNTYFLNFGPSRESLTAVIFSSAVELFEKNKQSPKQFENREVEIVGLVKDHPQYGLEIILEHPGQIKVVN